MAAGAPVSRGDVAQLQALATKIRTAAGEMQRASAQLQGTSGTVAHLIGGTASGKDREFVELLDGARTGVRAAIAACLEASGGVTRAAMHAEAQVRAQEQQAKRRV